MRLTYRDIGKHILKQFGWYVFPKKAKGGYELTSDSEYIKRQLSLWKSDMIVKVSRLNDLSLDQWADEFKKRFEENGSGPKHILSIDEFINTVNDGKMFSVKFVKRTNQEIRQMTARRGVRVGVKNDPGTNGSWNRKSLDKMHGILTVYDVNKLPDENEFVLFDEEGNLVNVKQRGAFRRIPLDSLISAKVHGVEYKYDPDKKWLCEV